MRFQRMEAYFKHIQISLIMRTRMLPLYADELIYQTHDHTYLRTQVRVNIYAYATCAPKYIITYA